ncbi:MAG: M23 family metallopeptidase [Chloroflexi bacterium]|nr:M23 family metallopeptidase [Chloroflexota bacterium]
MNRPRRALLLAWVLALGVAGLWGMAGHAASPEPRREPWPPPPVERGAWVVQPPEGYEPNPDEPPVWLPPAYPNPWAPSSHDHFLFGRIYPPGIEDIPLPSYRFAARNDRGGIHGGIDIPAPEGTPVLAIGSGRVVWTGEGLLAGHPRAGDPYGLAVAIRHDLGWQGWTLYTIYAHMSAIWVKSGQWVAQGTPIGAVGETGHADGPHVHLEIRYSDQGPRPPAGLPFLNPELWIAPPMGWGVLVGQVLNDRDLPIDYHPLTLEPLDWSRDIYPLWQWRHKLETHTYARKPGITPDPYYQENFAINNLPAGRYKITMTWNEKTYEAVLRVWPGRVTFFKFTPQDGFVVQEP